MSRLTYTNDKFYLDGKEYTILSGAMHYFRIPREYWRDRLQKLVECGFNTVETYTCWNLHERTPGVYDFSGMLDVEEYIRLASELGLNVILRPGPYICAEFDLGGLPSWLLPAENMPLRCADERFISHFERYLHKLFSHVSKFTGEGGSIIMLQIENEYGSYGNDKSYLKKIEQIYKDCGMDCLYFTSDGPTELMLSGGTLDGILSVANFGSKPKQNLEKLKKFRPNQPLMCGEYWCGWFDHWFEEHHVRTADEICRDLGEFFELGASFNFYMFHGGTNFAFTNGANYYDIYQPTVTSYDYNALLTEAGDRTEAYYRVREMIAAKTGHSVELTARESQKCAYGKVELCEFAPLFDNIDALSTEICTPTPRYMEDLDQDFGYILYRTEALPSSEPRPLIIEKVHDRALLFVDGKPSGLYDRRQMPSGDTLPRVGGDGLPHLIDILCENMGRVNYGPKLRDRKGISGVRFDYQYHFGWKQYPLPMEAADLAKLRFTKNAPKEQTPVFLRGKLTISGVHGAPCDTFVSLDNFTKGFVVINGHNLGRFYNPAGPQKTLYLPAPFLNEGENEIIIFESDHFTAPEIELVDKPRL